MSSVDPHQGYIRARNRKPVARRSGLTLTAPAVRDLLLVGLAVCSGAVDAISYLALGKVFSAFMTGNIVFLGLGLTGAGEPNVLRVCVALAAFAFGVATAVKVVKPTKLSALWPRGVSIALSLSALAQVSFLAGWMATSGRPSTGIGHVLIGISALAMGIQTGAVMSLGVPGIFTTAATATMVGLAGDLAGWPQSPNQRGRLFGVLAGICLGAAAGALLLVHARSYAPLLPVVGTLLVIMTACRLLGPQRRRSARTSPMADLSRGRPGAPRPG
jgi:uncharacterized membrane protein YoaK (UPF0700 family)